jgi:hypothetical protein
MCTVHDGVVDVVCGLPHIIDLAIYSKLAGCRLERPLTHVRQGMADDRAGEEPDFFAEMHLGGGCGYLPDHPAFEIRQARATDDDDCGDTAVCIGAPMVRDIELFVVEFGAVI